MTVQNRRDTVAHEAANNLVVALAAVGVLVVIALIGVSAIVGSAIVLSNNNYNNQPATQLSPTVAPLPAQHQPLPVPGSDLYPNMAGAS